MMHSYHGEVTNTERTNTNTESSNAYPDELNPFGDDEDEAPTPNQKGTHNFSSFDESMSQSSFEQKHSTPSSTSSGNHNTSILSTLESKRRGLDTSKSPRPAYHGTPPSTPPFQRDKRSQRSLTPPPQDEDAESVMSPVSTKSPTRSRLV